MELFGNAALVIAAAALLAFFMQRLGQSVIVAHLLLGMLVGPYALNRVVSSTLVDELAEIGVVLLLFFIGLEFHFGALRRTVGIALLGTLLQLVLTTAALATGGRLLGFTLEQSVGLGFCIALSSTAIVMKAFDERRESDTPWALASIALLLGQDLAAMAAIAASALLPAAAVTHELSRPAWLLLLLPVLAVVARYTLPRLFAKAALTRNAEVFALASLAACFVVAAAAHSLGASLALGAFLGGIVFADTPFAPQIRADLATVKNLALGLFFLSMGMLVDLRYVGSHLPLLTGALVATVVVKTIVTTLVLRAFRIPWSVAAGSGLALAQVSEFSFVLATGAGATLLGSEARQLLVPLAVLSMLPAPLLVGASGRFGQRVAGWLGLPDTASKPGSDDPAKTPPPETRAIVIGFGPVGRTLSRILIRAGVRVCVIDLHPGTIQKLQKIGREAVFGDAARREVLAAAGIFGARYLIVTLPDQPTRAAILASARALAPRITVLTRARYLEEQSSLEQLGADHISYEEAEVAMELARLLLTSLGVAKDSLEAEVRAIRSEIAVRTGYTMIHTMGIHTMRPPSAAPPETGPSP